MIKHTIIFFSMLMSSVLLTAQNGELKTEKDKASYAVGLSFEKNIEEFEQKLPVDESIDFEDFEKGFEDAISLSKTQSASYLEGVKMAQQIQDYLLKTDSRESIDFEIMKRALRDKYFKKDLKINPDSVNIIVLNYFENKWDAYNQKMEENKDQRRKDKTAVNTMVSEQFMEQNKNLEGVKEMPSGLQYQVIQQGEGKKPSIEDVVKIKYVGKTIDGNIFDDGYGEPMELELKKTIPGFQEGLLMMQEGGKYIFYIPYFLAYGENAPLGIGPNQVLIFNVELLKVIPAK